LSETAIAESAWSPGAAAERRLRDIRRRAGVRRLSISSFLVGSPLVYGGSGGVVPGIGGNLASPGRVNYS